MKLAIELIGLGIAIPGAIAFAIVWLSGRYGSARFAERASGMAVAAAFFVGCVLALGSDAVWPTRHWQWLAWGAVLAGTAGGIASDKIRAQDWRWLVLAAVALLCAWLMVPTWARLWPPRAISIALIAAYLFALMVLLNQLPERLLGTWFPAQLTLATGAIAVLLAAEISMTFGQLGIIAAAALGGCWAAGCFAKAPLVARSVVPVFAAMAGGLAYVGCVGRDPPLLALMLVATAPVALWVCAIGPLSRMRGASAGIVQTVIVIAPILAAITWAMLTNAE